MGEYSVTHEVASLDGFLTISINVHDEGNVLEIVGICCKYLLQKPLCFDFDAMFIEKMTAAI